MAIGLKKKKGGGKAGSESQAEEPPRGAGHQNFLQNEKHRRSGHVSVIAQHSSGWQEFLFGKAQAIVRP